MKISLVIAYLWTVVSVAVLIFCCQQETLSYQPMNGKERKLLKNNAWFNKQISSTFCKHVTTKSLNIFYVAKHINNLLIPEYLHQVPSFLNTLRNLYSWKNHHISLQDKILTGITTKEDEKKNSSITGGINDASASSKVLSPNFYLTPTKTKK